jgi:serine/threonine-protein kinase
MTQMTDGGTVDRRTVLRSVGTVALTGALAGCGGNGGDSGNGGSGNADVPSDVDDYLSDANNYGGGGVDETGSSSVSVEVGAANGYAFGPAAIIVDSGTEITWEWTGQGGAHNVVHDTQAGSQSEEAFNSGSTQTSGTFEYTFEETGNFLYYCTPHKAQGMKGAVVVE